MNKLFATFVLLFVSVCFSQAQDSYVKYHADSDYRSKTVKVFKGEIVPFYKSTKPNKINVVIGKDTITDLANTSSSFETVTPSKLNYLSFKDELIQEKKGVGIIVNISSLENTDSAYVYSESKSLLTRLVDSRTATINKADCGKTIRLVVSNTPTIYYEVDKLKQVAEPAPPEETATDETKSDEVKSQGGLAWWIWTLIGLAVVAIGFFVWKKFFKRGKSVNDNEVVFKGDSLKDFANQYGGIKKLIPLNPNLIPKDYEKLDQYEKKRIISDLKGRRLKIRADETQFGFQETQREEENSYTKTWEPQKETYVPPTTFSNNDNLAQQLNKVERNILDAIRMSGSNNANNNQLNEIRKEKQELDNKVRGLESEKRKVEEKLSKAELDFNDQYRKLQQSQDEVSRIEGEMKALKERVISLDFLKAYSESVFNYLKYCQQVSADAYNLFNRISQQNPKQAFAAGHLLMKYQSAVNNIPVGNWLQIAEDIKDSGATTNRQLTRSFSQIQNDAEKETQFKRQLFSQVLTKYSGNILILAEALKNLSRFQGANDFANEAHNTFGKHVTEILTKAKSTGLELKHVSLFESWEQHLGKVEEKGDEKSLAYKEISGLEKGAIAEIVSIGVKTTFEDTPTIVILA